MLGLSFDSLRGLCLKDWASWVEDDADLRCYSEALQRGPLAAPCPEAMGSGCMIAWMLGAIADGQISILEDVAKQAVGGRCLALLQAWTAARRLQSSWNVLRIAAACTTPAHRSSWRQVRGSSSVMSAHVSFLNLSFGVCYVTAAEAEPGSDSSSNSGG